MVKFQLNADDLNSIDENSREIAHLIGRLKKATSFKLGDYLICFELYYDTAQKALKTNTYGAAIKYVVVHTDANEVVYVKQLNSNNDPMGNIIPLISFITKIGHLKNNRIRDFEFELDPEYAESLIFQTDNEFNAMEKHNEAKSLRRQITEHNKKTKFNLDDCHSAIEVLNQLAVGHTYWISPKRGFTVLESKIVATPTGNFLRSAFPAWRHSKYKPHETKYIKYSNKKYQYVRSIKIKWSNGKEEQRLPHTFINTNLYSEIPRSYKELSDTN